ncbi:MAG TPA: oleate hydratase [Candidatus Ozemobacteraceae bacterium]|nr:oleate hydratase [Candidatus Ozemobacteraceae bacterium]
MLNAYNNVFVPFSSRAPAHTLRHRIQRQTPYFAKNRQMNNVKAYLAGGGLAGIATAFYLIKEGRLPGENINVFEASDFAGGSLDAAYEPEKNCYFMRGFRMFEEKVYSALFDMISSVPSLEDPAKTLMDEFVEFNQQVKTYSRARLLVNGQPVDARPFKMKFSDRIRLLRLLTLSENRIENVKIEDYFSSAFFESNFWLQFCTTFSFQPWHSLEELKRYILRFIQDSPVLDTQSCVRNTKYNQYDSIVLPIKNWLTNQGVHFQKNSVVSDVKFSQTNEKMRIHEISVLSQGVEKRIEIEKNGLVFLTLGSMTEQFSTGSMDKPPLQIPEPRGSSWELWKNISTISPEFGQYSVFNSDIDKTKWVSFTVTFSDPLFFQYIEKITRSKAGTEGPISIKDSNWLISFALPNQPHFINQPENLQVIWGYGLYPDKVGNFVKKKMSECSGREILVELLYHLKFENILDDILGSAICIPCTLPYITSQFMPRKSGDRPNVVPACSENFAFIGQYCEIPEDIVFTLEYSVRSAQIAVFSLLNSKNKPTPIYPGWKSLRNLFNAVRTTFR